jgi:hypothetical protein
MIPMVGSGLTTKYYINLNKEPGTNYFTSSAVSKISLNLAIFGASLIFAGKVRAYP